MKAHVAESQRSSRTRFVPVIQFADNLSSVVRYALETTRATTTCPFHLNLIIRVGDVSEESLSGNLERPQTVTVRGVRF